MKSFRDIDTDLGSSDPEVRRRATAAVAELSPADGAARVLRALGDSDWRVRKEASSVAATLGPADPLLDRLVTALFPGDNVGLRNAVVETLAAFGRSAIPAVTRVIHRLDADGKKLAAEVLGRAHDPIALEALESLYADADANVRTAALEAIADIGPLAVDAASRTLLGALDAEDTHLKLAALEGLNRLGIVVPWEKLRPLTGHRILGRAALAAASRAGRIEAAEALALALEHESPAMFRLAMVGLAELAVGAEVLVEHWKGQGIRLGNKARDRLLEAMAPESQDVEGRRAALVVAAVVNEPAGVDLAIDALVDDAVAREADAALRIFGPPALPRLLARVANGASDLRAAAIARLSELVEKDSEESVRLALRAAIADSSTEVASAALASLGSLGGPEDIAPVFAVVTEKRKGCLPAARGALALLARRYPEDARLTASVARRDQSSQIATSIVIGALKGDVLGSVAEDVLYLAAALSSADPETRLTAIEAVAEVGSDLGMEAVQFALADEEREIQLSAVRALGRLRTLDGRAAGADRLVELVGESNEPELTAAAARALGEAADPRARLSLRPLALSKSPLVAVAAVETLGKLDDPDRIEPLLEAARHPNSEVVKAALLALESVRDRRALDQLGQALTHEAWDVRRLAADCLGRFGGRDAAWVLRDRMLGEGEPLVREAMGRALSAIEAPSTARRPATIAPPKGDP
ncbi:MAG TPA: HEAT repeat domain-containing protein [Polyangiaceae bacterium]|nr:HEAT repeat domain-containing protein [Polyangiaceae bacterium]